MIRAISSDELEWFLANSFSFIGHTNPRGFARQAVQLMRDPDAEAENCAILLSNDGKPLAGLHILAPQPEDDSQNLYLSNIWFEASVDDLATLVRDTLRRHPHEAAHLPLYNFTDALIAQVQPAFERLEFQLKRAHDLTFELAELPPLGLPLVLEAWSDESDKLFQAAFAESEGFEPSDEFWAWLKRWRGKFTPDYWFLMRETLDQDPVGYAFYGIYHDGLEGAYYLSAVGALAKYRDSSEMLRRLLLSSMHDLASRSPFGQIKTTVTQNDPKLIEIMESIGFMVTSRYQLLVRRPQ